MSKFIIGILTFGLIFNLAIFTDPQNATAVDSPIDYFGDCTFAIKFPNQGAYTVKSFKLSPDMKQLTGIVAKGGTDKTYPFDLVKVASNPSTKFYYAEYENPAEKGMFIRLDRTNDSEAGVATYNIDHPNTSPKDSEYVEAVVALGASIGPGIVCNSSATLWPGGTFNTQIDFHGDQAPTMRIGGNSAGRPAMIFKLTHTLAKKGIATNDIIYEFTYLKNDGGTVEAKYANLAIKLLGAGNNAFVALCTDPTSYTGCKDLADNVVVPSESSKKLLYQHVFNPKSAAGSDTKCDGSNPTTYQSSNADPTKDLKLATNWGSDVPDMSCLNVEDNGWLAKWGVNRKVVSYNDPSGLGPDSNECGSNTWAWRVGDNMRVAICNMGLILHGAADSFVTGAVNMFKKVVGLKEY